MDNEENLKEAKESFAWICNEIASNLDDPDFLDEADEWLINNLEEADANNWYELAERIRQEKRRLNELLKPFFKGAEKPARPIIAEELRKACLGKKMANLGFRPRFRGWTNLTRLGTVALWGVIENLSVEVYYRKDNFHSGFIIVEGPRSFGQGGETLLHWEFADNQIDAPLHTACIAKATENEIIRQIVTLLVKPLGITPAQVQSELNKC